MVWKGVAGLPLVVSGVSPDADPWVFGNGLVDGGTAPNGTVLYHVLKARSF
jgi:hypothetical protein